MTKNINKLLEKYESKNEKDLDEDINPVDKSKNKKELNQDSLQSINPVRNVKIKLDLKDKKILYQLELNARQSNSQIAKKVGLSKEVVNYRIKRLETFKVIKSYYPIIDLSKLGYINFRIYLRLMDATPKKEKEILEYLINNKESFYVSTLDGRFDLSIGVAVKEIHEFESFYNQFKDNFKQFIRKEQISIFTAVYHFNRNYLLDEKISRNPPAIIGKSPKEEFDNTDINILKILSKNSRIPLIDISKKLFIPERTIAFRIKKLEQKKIILCYKALLNLNSLGYEYFKLDIILKDTSRIKELLKYAESNPYITYIDQTIAGSDFEFDIEVKNKQHLLEIVNDLKIKFPEIREWSYFTLLSYDKLIYLPSI